MKKLCWRCHKAGGCTEKHETLKLGYCDHCGEYAVVKYCGGYDFRTPSERFRWFPNESASAQRGALAMALQLAKELQGTWANQHKYRGRWESVADWLRAEVQKELESRP